MTQGDLPSMSNGRATSHLVPGDLARLFDGSSLVGLTDGELLARFVAGRDEGAFEGLVARLGPMVLGVCRRMLADRADADDAFQATFLVLVLVLVRRAGSVGRGDLIGPWLHGVAVRVCRRARAQTAKRNVREQTGVVVDYLPPASPFAASSPLARARTRLRANLTRRGCVPPSLSVFNRAYSLRAIAFRRELDLAVFRFRGFVGFRDFGFGDFLGYFCLNDGILPLHIAGESFVVRLFQPLELIRVHSLAVLSHSFPSQGWLT